MIKTNKGTFTILNRDGSMLEVQRLNGKKVYPAILKNNRLSIINGTSSFDARVLGQ